MTHSQSAPSQQDRLVAPMRLINVHEVANRRGVKKTRLYADVREGLLTPPIRMGANCARWVEHEVDAVVRARIAGIDDDGIRELISDLVAARSELIAPWHQGAAGHA